MGILSFFSVFVEFVFRSMNIFNLPQSEEAAIQFYKKKTFYRPTNFVQMA